MRSRSLLLLAVLAIALIGWIAFSDVSRRSSRPLTPPETADTRVAQAEVRSLGERARVVDTSSSVADDVPRQPGGRVTDALLGAPLDAVIRLDRGDAVFTVAETGRFTLDQRHDGFTTLRVSAAGFHDEVVDVDAALLAGDADIRLRSVRFASLIVERADGSPVAHAHVAWRALADEPRTGSYLDRNDLRSREIGNEHGTTTDTTGTCRIALAVEAAATVVDPLTKAQKTVTVVPGDVKRVVFPARSITLRFVDHSTNDPLRGLEIDVWEVRDATAMTDRARTDEHGEITIAPACFPVLVRRPGSAAFQSELLPIDSSVATSIGGDTRTTVRIAAHPADTLEIHVRRCGGSLKLVDAESKAPIDGIARVARWSASGCEAAASAPTRCTLRSPRSSFSSPHELLAVERGVVDLPCRVFAADGSDKSALPNVELSIFVTGYAPFRGPIPTTHAAPVIELTRAVEKRIRALHADGRPFVRELTLYSPSNDVLSWHSYGSADGIHGPFDWLGGDLVVNRQLVLSAAAIEADDDVTITFPAATGSIVVQGIPDAVLSSTLVAKGGLSLEGHAYRASALDGTTCQFDSLPPGAYLVGPRRWVDAADIQSYSHALGENAQPQRARVKVGAGEVVVIPWKSEWASSQTIEGRVVVDGASTSSFLVPLYGLGDARMPDAVGASVTPLFSRSAPRLATDADGNYRIDVGELVPTAIAVCIAVGNTWGSNELRVFDVIAPGESIVIPTASIELRAAPGALAADVEVAYDVVPSSDLVQIRPHHTQVRVWWKTAQPVTLDLVPLDVRTLLVSGRTVEVDLEANKHAVLEIPARASDEDH